MSEIKAGDLYVYRGDEGEAIAVARRRIGPRGGWTADSIARMSLPSKHVSQDELNAYAASFASVADLTASRDRASDACASVQRERDEAVDLLAFAIDQIDYFINANYGGEVPCTNEEFEKFERLRAFLSRYEGEVK